jgi:hypothetical protein
MFNAKSHYVPLNRLPRKFKLFLAIGSACLIAAAMLVQSLWVPSKAGGQVALAEGSSQVSIFLPITMLRNNLTTQFGFDLGTTIYSGGVDKMTLAGASWTRKDAALWSAVQPTSSSTFDWSALQGLEADLLAAQDHGLHVILIVRGTPSWAQKVPGYSCGAIAPAALPAFATFMHDLVARYSVPPYNVKYWELWNEPDVDPSIAVTPDSGFGCWGDASDPYYGGGYYADMLQAIYQPVKSADPQSQVLVGGLLLDCNPNVSPANDGCATAAKQKPPMFFEGILRHNGANDGAQYFDGVSFHAYDIYDPSLGAASLGHYRTFGWSSSWNTTGPTVTAKFNFLKNLLADPSFGASGKFFMNTETALICTSDTIGAPPCQPDDTSIYEKSKANYVAQVYATGQALGLRTSIWYSVFGWRNSALLNFDKTPRLAYTAYTVARSELRDAIFQNKPSLGAGVMAYAFNRVDRRIWVLWSLDGNTHNVDLGGVPLAINDAMGVSITPSQTIQVDLKPLYIEWRP